MQAPHVSPWALEWRSDPPEQAISITITSTLSLPVPHHQPTAMSRSIALITTQRRIYADAFAKWPKQDLRPDYQLQDILKAAVEERYKNYNPAMEAEETLKARALQFLVQDKFNNRYKLKGPMLEPKSQPTYFQDLVREIEEAPRRTWLERLGKRLSGMIRLQ
ncbi:hypothetical protein MAC_09679 [Metarhizium acridum CQMa 102]|uniref:Uncharacterized protein n=1 Tax=Metarhizium acridum (strain CQMa 102) TaxID=655827 RepID=E9EII1_METAQ|nr:uncharacterized protein MAC_09679 [Metarhizium acridum CQMa 102]EFY84271.1 hypothetical protein MAC_09679 [Metarhizium acridum CQMa 102]